jgi:hypothetical protein
LRTLSRPLARSLAFSSVAALFGLACSGEPSPGGLGTTSGGMVSQTGGMPGAGQTQVSGGNATAGSNASAGTSVGGTNAASGSAGATNAGQPSAGTTNAGSGGSGGAAGGTNGGGTSGGTNAGGTASGCSGVTSKFCEDWEKQTTGMAPTGDFKAGKNMVVDESKAYSGTKALHIHSAKPTTESFMSFTKQFPMNDFHGRAMFYLTSIPTSDNHWDLIDALSSNHWEIGGMFGKFIFVVDPPDHSLTSIVPPTGKWFCLQWEFKYGGQGADNTFVAKMDGTVLDKGMFTGADSDGKKWAAGPWQNMNIGWTSYGASDVDTEEWIDDLAIGDMPIPCPAAK